MSTKPSSAGEPDRPESVRPPASVLVGEYASPPLSRTLTGGLPHRTVLFPGEMPGRTRRFEREIWPGGRPSDSLAADIRALEGDHILPCKLREHLWLIVKQLRGLEDAEGLDTCLDRSDFSEQISVGRSLIDAARRELSSEGRGASRAPASTAGRPRNPNAKYQLIAQFLLRAEQPYTVKRLRASLSVAPHSVTLRNWHRAVADAIQGYPDQLASWRDGEGVVFVGPVRFWPKA